MAHETLTTAQVLHGVKLVKSADGAIDLQKLEYIAAVDDRRVWRDAGARNLIEWVSAEFQESHWTARRWVGEARALPDLPKTQRAMRTGALSLVKVCELVRFATPETEGGLIRWAQGVSAAAIRRRAYRETVDPIEEVRADHDARSLSWWYEDDRRLHLEGLLPAEQGAGGRGARTTRRAAPVRSRSGARLDARRPPGRRARGA